MASSAEPAALELREIHSLPQPKQILTKISSRLSRNRSDAGPSEDEIDTNEALPSPTTAPVEHQMKWNESKTMMFRTFAAFWGFIIMGANDAAVGVSLLPSLY
jgi:hypothetical protein